MPGKPQKSAPIQKPDQSQDINFYFEYVFLCDSERRRIAEAPHEYP